MNTQLNVFLRDALALPTHAIKSAINWHLRECMSEFAILETTDGQFDVESYSAYGYCTLTLTSEIHPHVDVDWDSDSATVTSSVETCIYDIEWNEKTFSLLRVSWPSEFCNTEAHWLIGTKYADIEDYFKAVCQWHPPTEPTVWIFEDGHWARSRTLYHAIKSATLDNLILVPGLKEELQADLSHFFESRPIYERYGIPWKRGVLLTGSPGNGKTHAVKALINWLDKPTLYVRSIKSRHHTDHATMHQVFSYARAIAPCVLVFEDLETIVTPTNRSYFLNELDGFASNTGILVLATTNHPELLDPAITERPSRFDRKYTFDLPALAERMRYLSAWNERIEKHLQLTEAGLATVADQTVGFSFAFLKELIMAAMMRWINVPDSPSMDAIMTAQTAVLRSQMSSMETTVPEILTNTDDEEED